MRWNEEKYYKRSYTVWFPIWNQARQSDVIQHTYDTSYIGITIMTQYDSAIKVVFLIQFCADSADNKETLVRYRFLGYMRIFSSIISR